MSPIFVRPVREQLEHDRLIRHLSLDYKRTFEVTANVGDEQLAPVKVGSVTLFPDIVLMTAANKLAGIVEVETGESVNHLEAMAQWQHFGRSRAPFYLYVPVQGYDAARRLCESLRIKTTEVWTYRPALEGFDLVRMFVDASASRRAAADAAKAAARPAKAVPAGKASSAAAKSGKSGKKSTKPAPTKASKPSKRSKPSKAAKKAPRASKAAKTTVRARTPRTKGASASRSAGRARKTAPVRARSGRARKSR